MWQDKVFNWVENNKYEGYDPYDILSYNSYTRSLMVGFRNLSPIHKISFLIVDRSNLYFPKTTRNLLGVKPLLHPTYLGCLLRAYLNKKDLNLNKINEIKALLLQTNLNYKDYYTWGTPFQWRSGETHYPLGTPFTVVCNWVGMGFFDAYRKLKSQEDLDVCISICEFFMNELHQVQSENGVCFSYSPLKSDVINNANLMAAEFLMIVGSEVNNQDYIDAAEKAVSFTLNTQHENGLIPYVAYGERKGNDSYHGSYEMKSLFSIYRINKDPKIKKSIDSYLDYYLKNYVQEDFSITKYPKRKYPVDGTAIADGLILLHELKEEYDLSYYINGLNDLIEKEWVKSDGSVFYKKISNSKFVAITYPRWIMGWFTLAASYER